MQTLIRQSVLAAVLLAAAASASAGATVTFVQPEKFTDVPFTTWEREQVLKDLQAHFDKLAAKLPAGQQLKVEVTDIDLAGETWPNRFQGRDIRIMKGGADWPRISLSYTITEGDQVVKSGQDNLADMAYQFNMTRYGGDDALRYEKRLLDDWFRDRVAVK